MGNGPSFVSQDVFNEVVFGGNPSERDRLSASHACSRTRKELKALWNAKARRLGQSASSGQSEPRRVQGGRRPIDIFWRIAKGINGAQMPAHYPSPLNEAKVWDLVNFVLALPYEPELLRDVAARQRARPSRHRVARASERVTAVKPAGTLVREPISVIRSRVVARSNRVEPRLQFPDTLKGSVSVRYWSVLFALAAILSVGGFVYAAILARLVAARSRNALRT